MENKSFYPALQSRALEEAQRLGIKDAAAGPPSSRPGGWYALRISSPGQRDFQIFVRPAKDPWEVRSDRVLEALDRQCTAECRELLHQGEAAWAQVSFLRGVPAKPWPDTAAIQQVAQGDALGVRWVFLTTSPQPAPRATAVAAALACLGRTGTLYVGCIPDQTMNLLEARGSMGFRSAMQWAQGGLRLRVVPVPGRTAQQILRELEKQDG